MKQNECEFYKKVVIARDKWQIQEKIALHEEHFSGDSDRKFNVNDAGVTTSESSMLVGSTAWDLVQSDVHLTLISGDFKFSSRLPNIYFLNSNSNPPSASI